MGSPAERITQDERASASADALFAAEYLLFLRKPVIIEATGGLQMKGGIIK